MKAFLHIGTEKTGTTTLQNFLYKNRSILLENGILYPTTPGKLNHIDLVACSAQLDNWQDIRSRLYGLDYSKFLKFKDAASYRQNFLEKLEEEIAQVPADKIIFSSEHLSSRLYSKEEVEALRQTLSELFQEISIIIYLRRQDDLLVSAYSTKVICDGRTEPISELPDPETVNNYYDYKNILDKWESVFGRENIIVRRFAKQNLVENNLMKDFVDAAQISWDDRFEAVPPQNLSYGVENLEMLRLMNKHVPRYDGDRLNPQRRYLMQYIKEYQGGSYSLVSKAFRKQFLESFSDSNAYVAEHYLRRDDGKLFDDEIAEDDLPVFDGFSADRLAEIFAYIWRKENERTHKLENENRTLKKNVSLRKRVFDKLKKFF